MIDVQTPAARNTDPQTSHEAADAITQSGTRKTQQQAVIDALYRQPGATTAELAFVMGMDRHMVGRRMKECETAGYAQRGTTKRCTVSGRSAQMWWPVPKQRGLF